MALLGLYTILGLLTLASALYRVVQDTQRARRIRRGEARAADILEYLDMQSYDELDILRRRAPDLLEVLPGLSGAYAAVEFRFSPWRLANHRPWSLNVVLRSIPAHAICLAMIVAAWLLGHTRGAGWAALFAALAIELLRWVADRTTLVATIVSMARDLAAHPPAPDAPPLRTAAVAEHAAGAEAVVALASARPWPRPDPAAIQFTTIVLLRHAWRPAANVLYASLRRCGQRDAYPPDDSVEPGIAVLRAGHTTLYVRPAGTPCDHEQLANLLPLTGDSVASQVIEEHADHLIVTTSLPRAAAEGSASSTALTILRLHARTHLALAEFAPALAAIWTRVGRLVPADRFRQVAEAEPFPVELFNASAEVPEDAPRP